VPTRFIACRDDRFFPAAWLRGVVRDRLGIEPAEIPGGHCAFLSRPRALAAALVDCGVGRTGGAAAASRARPRR
jgi:pimeloyl-ACP methyl ester carboxylesterase